MNKLIILFLVCCSFSAFAQEKTYFDIDWEETNKKNAVYYRTVEPVANLFKVSDYYIEGNLQFVGFSKTKKEPIVLEGLAQWFNFEGILLQKGNFMNNELEGDYQSFYTNGEMKTHEIYSKGELNGEYIKYFPSGETSLSSYFQDGQLHGVSVKYSSPGVLEYKISYQFGKVHGDYQSYFLNGKLSSEGSANNDIQDGKCKNYNYEGNLIKEYTILDSKLDGKYTEYSNDGEEVCLGKFEKGKAISFQTTSRGTINGSQFRSNMELKDSVEYWKVYRDDKLIAETAYKLGFKTGIWNIFNYDGTKLYQTLSYDQQTSCSDPYLQVTTEAFNALFTLSSRFNITSDLLKNPNCSGVEVVDHMDERDQHPFYFLNLPNPSKSNRDKNDQQEKSRLIEFQEPASGHEFLKKNNCIQHEEYDDVTVCIRKIGEIEYHLFLSESALSLMVLQLEADPEDNEVYFYYEKLEERTYDLNNERIPDRYMSFKIPGVLAEAFTENKFYALEVIGALEHDFWDVGNFSGMAAYSALEKQLPD